MRNIGIIVRLFIIMTILFSTDLFSQDKGCWNIFRGDPALTGVTRQEIPSSLSVLWTFKTSDEIKSSPVVCNNRIVAGSTDGNVYCLDLEGSLQWKFSTGNVIEAGALILDGMVYVGNLDGIFYALDLNTGVKKWEYSCENQISGSANWVKKDGTTLLFFGSYDYNMHCVDASSGKGIWKYESDNFINGAAARYNNNAVFGGCDGFLHVVNLQNGQAEATIEVATYIAGSAAIAGNKAFVGDYDGGFTCVDLEKKEIAWRWEEEDSNLPFIASPAVSGKLVVTGNENKFVYCYNGENGELLWKVNARARVHASPIISGNKVLVVNLRGDILVLDLLSGEILLDYELGSPLTANPALADGRIILGAGDGTIYCLGTK